MFLSEWREFPFGAELCGEEEPDDSSYLDVVETECATDMLPSI